MRESTKNAYFSVWLQPYTLYKDLTYEDRMKSNSIKNVVVEANLLIRSTDYTIEKPHNQLLITNISKKLNQEFKNNPKFVSAIISYIESHGYQLCHARCSDTQKILQNTKKVLEAMDPKDFNTIRAVCESMFSQYVPKY
jgi:hypothetical protein